MSAAKLDGERRVEEFLARKGLRVGRLSKAEMRRGKTPDFRVFAGNEIAFYCEVKTRQKDEWLDKQLASAPPCTIVGGPRPDPTYHRISEYIQRAVEQLDAVNPTMQYPNVLAIFSGDDQSDRTDLIQVVTGNAYCASGEVIPMFKEFSEGSIREAKWRVHMYLWFDAAGGEPKMYFPAVHPVHHASLCRNLGVDPAQVKWLPGSNRVT